MEKGGEGNPQGSWHLVSTPGLGCGCSKGRRLFCGDDSGLKGKGRTLAASGDKAGSVC